VATAEEAEAARRPDLQAALDLAFRFLGARDRTVAEVRRRLQRGDVEPAVVDRAIAGLTEQGYLDDARFARRFAEDRRHLDGWGSARIEERLVALGVDPPQAAAVATRERDEELEAAIGVLKRRVSFPLTGDNRARDRAPGVLLRRGYEVELARDAVRAHEHEGRVS
jgi:regulatory protein